MKHILLILSAIALMMTAASCGVLSSSSDEVNAAVANATVENGIYVSVTTILPQTGSALHRTDGYYLQIKDGKVTSYLPFFGTSYSSDVYGKASGIDFDHYPVTISETQKKNSRIWTFEAKQEQELIQVTLEFTNSGMANISCRSNRRSVMRYVGNVETPPTE